MDRIRVGVIGCGYWGPNLIRNFVEIPQSEVVIVADLREERLSYIKASYPQISITKDYQDLFDLDLDAVVISTPPATHYQLARECLQHDLHVLVEKPITTKSEHAEELIQIAKTNGLVLMVGHTFKYNVAIDTLKSLIDSGELGQIYYLDSARLNLGLFQREMNAMWDLAPHDISIMHYILGCPPISVSAHGMPFVFEGIHDVVYMNMVFPDNIHAHIHVSWLDPCKVRRITIVGSKKMVVYNDILIPNIRFSEPLRQECQHFLECINNHCEPVSGGRDGLEVVKVLETAQLSLSRNGIYQEMIAW